MSLNVTFPVVVGQMVEAKIGQRGRVTMTAVDDSGFYYLVEWVTTAGEVNERWFRPTELVDET